MINESNDIKYIPAQKAQRAPDYRVIYCNSSTISFTPWDFNFSLGQNIDANLVDLASVVMSPQHAKALLKHWGEAIAKYESIFGEIDDPSARVQKLKQDEERRASGKAKPSKQKA